VRKIDELGGEGGGSANTYVLTENQLRYTVFLPVVIVHFEPLLGELLGIAAAGITLGTRRHQSILGKTAENA
jgi:hypothetical protein